MKKPVKGSITFKVKKNAKPSVKFDYIKSNYFRVVHADGIFGGVTPQGLLQMVFFNERFPIPTQMEYQLTPEGKIGQEIAEGRVSRNALIRELDVEILMNAEIARSVYNWLGDNLKKLDEVRRRLGK